MMSLHNDIEKVLVSEADILEISKRLGKEISKDYASIERPILLGLLKMRLSLKDC